MELEKLHKLFLESSGVCTDTRKLEEGQLFFALKGDNFDGNKYALQALDDGASFAIIDDSSIDHSKVILVENGLNTLQELANFHRKYLKIPIVALTGSNGKTTTKELISAVLSSKFNCVATKGNLNNHIGVPLTLLSMDSETEIGVVEMGANHLKEIALLSEIAVPDFGYITNIGKAHLEGFGSEENILIGKTELYDFIRNNNGIIFLNEEDEKLVSKSENLKTVTFSNSEKSDFNIELLSANPFVKVKFNDTEITSNLIGNYNYTNIAASIAIGSYFKVSTKNIKKAIENYVPSNNRSQLKKTANNKLILDAYNANPSSMTAAISTFEASDNGKEKVVILGDMFELGVYAQKEHQKIVDLLQKSTISKIYMAGENFATAFINDNKFKFFKTTDGLINELKANPIKEAAILIKGSRGMALERVVELL